MNTNQKLKVAIKQIWNLFDREVSKRAYREIKLLNHFKGHPNIIQIMDIFVNDDKKNYDTVYIVFEKMDVDLNLIIQSDAVITSNHRRLYLYQILRGLLCIHRASVIHRDLKPKNLLVNMKTNDLKICDLGTGRDNNSLRLTTFSIVCTSFYKAPEGLIDPSLYAASVDLWSVGCILVELMKRTPLFPGKTDEQLFEYIITDINPSEEELKKITNEKYLGLGLSILKEKNLSNFTFLNTDEQEMNLLKGLLKLDPSTRFNVKEALSHPYFENLHDEETELSLCNNINEFPNLPSFVQAKEWRQLLWNEVEIYNNRN